MRQLKAFLKDENGASAGEYALILAVVGTAVAAGSFLLGADLKTGMGLIGGCIAGKTPVTSAGC